SQAFQKHLFAICLTITVRIFQYKDPAVAGTREPMSTRYIIPVFSDPKPTFVIPAKSHRLGNHRLSSPDIYFVAFFDSRRFYRFLRLQKFSITPLFLRDPPEFCRAIHAYFPREISPPIIELQVINFPRMNY